MKSSLQRILVYVLIMSLLLLMFCLLAQLYVSLYSAASAAELEHIYLPYTTGLYIICRPPAFKSGQGCLVMPPPPPG